MKKAFKFTAFIMAMLFSGFIGFSLDKSSGNILDNSKPAITSEAVTYNHKRHLYFTPNEKYVKHIGRSVYADDCLWFSMSGSGIEFITSADNIDITFICDNAENLYSTHKPRIAIFVNDEQFYADTLKEAEKIISLDISKHIGDKIIKVIKLSETMYSSCGISKIAIFDDKDIIPTEEKDLKIEFIGDSITAGYGIDEERDFAPFSTETENFTKTYAYLTSQKLKADYSAIAFSGYGILSGQSKPECVVPKYYENAITNKSFNCPYPLEKWNFSKFTPDIIIVNLGVNDVAYCTTQSRKASFIKEYKDFIGLIRWYNKEAHIVCTLGEINNSMFPSIETAVKEYTEETADTKVYCTTLDFDMGNNGTVINGHPNEQANITASENLTEIITKIQSGTFKSSYENALFDETTTRTSAYQELY